MRFGLWSSNKRLIERVFDAGLLLLFIGIIFRETGVPARDLRCVGVFFLGWCAISWGFQRANLRNSIRNYYVMTQRYKKEHGKLEPPV